MTSGRRRELGRGRTGVVYTAGVLSDLLRRTSEGVGLIGGEGVVVGILAAGPAGRAGRLELADRLDEGGLVVKWFLRRAWYRQDMLMEVRATQRVRGALDAGAAERLTTFAEVRVRETAVPVLGLDIWPTGGCWTFSRRCSPALDLPRDQPWHTLVDHVLDTFCELQAAGLSHCDMHVGNLVTCDWHAPPYVRFKVVDWGSCLHLEPDLVELYGLSSAAAWHPFKSPWAWHLRGWSAAASCLLFAMAGMRRMWLDHVSTPEAVATVASISASAFGHMMTGAVDVTSAVHRRTVVQTLDLFDVGIVLYALAARSKRRRGVTRDLARRLTHYGAPDFLWSAIDARRGWQQMRGG